MIFMCFLQIEYEILTAICEKTWIVSERIQKETPFGQHVVLNIDCRIERNSFGRIKRERLPEEEIGGKTQPVLVERGARGE